jgi:hypothetical protein
MSKKLANVRISELANEKIHLLIFAFLYLLFVQSSFAQSISATLKVDSTHILIGDHLNVTLTLKHSRGLQITMPATGDTLGNMDVINVKSDTGNAGNELLISRTYTVSAFDSGTYHAGPVMVFLKYATGDLDTLYSNQLPIQVTTVPVDTTKAIKPIKAPLEVPYSWKEFIPYMAAGALLLLSIAVIIILWLKFRKKKPVPVVKPKPKEPAHIWARAELKKLEEEKLWQKDEVKLYYSKLTDILRQYLEYRYNWQALESTTEEIEVDLPRYNLKEKAKDNLLEILRTADLVKFAKLLPLPDVNIRMMDSAYKFIDFTELKESQTEKK